MLSHLCTREWVSLTWCATPRVSRTLNALGQKVMALPSSLGAGSRSSTTTGMPTWYHPPSNQEGESSLKAPLNPYLYSMGALTAQNQFMTAGANTMIAKRQLSMELPLCSERHPHHRPWLGRPKLCLKPHVAFAKT